MATGTLAPSPYLTIFDSNGDPVSGGKVYTYLAGTTTLAATYTDVGLSVANANPIIADAAGRFIAFLSPGASYKFVVQDANGSAIRSQDNISAVPTSSSNLDITGVAGEALTAGVPVYLSDGSGSRTPGSWYLTDSDFSYTSITPTIGFTTAIIASGASGTIRLAGTATGLSSLVVGTTYYISATPGVLTSTAPANRRIVGVADTTTSLVMFPSVPTLGSTSTITTTGTQTALVLPTGDGNLTIFANNATLLTLQGIAAARDGQQLTLYAIGAGQVDLNDQNGSATATNRIVTGRGATISLPPGSGAAYLQYDSTATRWRVLAFMSTTTSTTTTTGTQTALGIPTGMGALTIFANNATLLTLQGITAGFDGQSLTIYSIGAGQVDLANQNGSASAANRIMNGVTGTISLAAGMGRVSLVYDATTARWRVLQHEQGAWLTPAFSAGNFTASSGTWTLASGDVSSARYWLRGNTMTVAFAYITTTVSATPANLQIGNGTYGGFTAGANSPVIYAYLLYNDNGGGNAIGYCAVNASDTKIVLAKISGTWSAATDTTNVFGTITFEVG